MKSKQISIIGCGWLGLSLADHLIKKKYIVKGSSTTPEKIITLSKLNINAFQITLKNDGINGNINAFLEDSDTLIINIPPGLRRNPNKNHVKEIKHLIGKVEKSTVKNLLYISSTSVFENNTSFTIINDYSTPNATSKSARQLIEIEELLKTNSNFTTTILRFGGLFDELRHPAKYLSGKQNVKNPNAPINLIHKLDCIGIITSILKQDLWGITLNAVYPYHPKKIKYYTSFCKINHLPIPKFDISGISKGKLVNSKKILIDLNYSFKHKP